MVAKLKGQALHDYIESMAREPKPDYKKAVEETGLVVENLRPRVCRMRKRLGVAAGQRGRSPPKPRALSVAAVEDVALKVEMADDLLRKLAETSQVPESSLGGDAKVREAVRDGARKLAESIYRRFGIGATQTNIQVNVANIAQDKTKLKELLALWENDDDALRALWAWVEPRARKRGWR